MTSVELDGSLLLKSSVAFTGRLACMSRAEAFDVIRQRGGMPSPAVTKRTQVLIVGELGWPYSAEQLATLSKMSIGMVRELSQLSLLDERDGRFGFRVLASARQIAKLLNDGVRLSA